MYAYIEGELKDLNEDYIIIDVFGIGYEVWCPNPYRFQSQLNQKTKVYTYLYVREDSQMLYGFKQAEEKDLFKKLLNVSGIGPKNALSIVSQTSAHDFAVAVEQENDAYLTKFPGVGKKTARQMILDLKGKVDEWMQVQTDDILTIESEVSTTDQKAFEEAIQALQTLGYTKKEIDQISPKLKAETLSSTDDLVKHGLKLLM
ncbi:Holliday junction branch migration protein RuvA [Alkalibacillus aidingensis]|uniref:Holliday junction branch migration protein RuvA n=1 Tax=Alkalibacillus aidingensis TaxID=2747607 RepID=UPI0016606529|nr:Holliday junction branch migration protein RuvA [Alkalibacillus aidingensis]